jgi:CRISPR-associated protein Cmr5
MPVLNRGAQPMIATGVTLEQRRAADAWQCAKKQSNEKEYANLAKGLPALIMNSGLLQVMAFLHEKGKKDAQAHCRVLGTDLRSWLHQRFPDVPAEFGEFMAALMNADSRKFQAITTESLAWLRWLRQMAAAVIREER